MLYLLAIFCFVLFHKEIYTLVWLFFNKSIFNVSFMKLCFFLIELLSIKLNIYASECENAELVSQCNFIYIQTSKYHIVLNKTNCMTQCRDSLVVFTNNVNQRVLGDGPAVPILFTGDLSS